MTRLAAFAVAAVALSALPAGQARAGITKKLGAELAAGAVEKIEPALARTLADVDSRLTVHELRIGNVVGGLVGQTSHEIGERLGQVDGILEKRLLQVQLGVDQVLDHGLDKIDGVARGRLLQLNSMLAARIQQVSGEVAKTLTQADGILKERIADVGGVVTGAIDRADGALGARIEQLDEVAGRRLGNVDVIASKQRLGLERTITRAAWLLALVAFVVVALRTMWKEYTDEDAKEAIAEAHPGTERAGKVLAVIGKPLLRQAAVAGVVAALLALVPERLPMAAAKEQQALVARHAEELERGLADLDFTRVRFHASQLEILEPVNVAHYQALAAKAELLRDLLSRPTALATTGGANAILDRVRALERMQDGRRDPDAETVRAMVLWQRGDTRRDEHEAASRAARALWSSPRGFTLAPMARLIVEAYLHAPAPGPAVAAGATLVGGVAPGSEAALAESDLESTAGLRASLDLRVSEKPGSPFEGTAALFHLMQTLDAESTKAFVAMVEAQARASAAAALAKKRNTVDLTAAKVERNARAVDVVKAWEEFDRGLRETPVLASSALVLSVFRLNDVMLSHALWFTTQPDTVEWPPKLANLGTGKGGEGKSDRLKKLAMAPARAVWARRYADLLSGPARELVELQEADRFERMENDMLTLERGLGTLAGDPAARPAGISKKAAARMAAAPELTRLEAANAAAALGMYQGQPGARTPLALAIAGSLTGLETKLAGQLAALGTKARGGLERGQASKEKQLHDLLSTGLDTLRARLVGRGPKLL